MKNEPLLKRIWHFIWYDDSLLSWIVNLILAFIIIKYLLFPFLGLILGSKFPVVAVVSTSMEHDGNFDTWWNSQAYCNNKICTQEKFYSSFNITKEQFQNFKLKNGFNKGDVMVLTSVDSIKIGDIVVFFSKDGRPIIHRIISLNPMQTKGDHNQDQIKTNALNETNVQKQMLIGKASFRIPLLGYVKILFAWLLSLFGLQVA
jgi:hypothetical protein